ncbi:MAG TPA: hypothetical protein VKM55_10370 [Candidatus Lokiarchaeia archaeon]|nr:hypothetical protein [Candidatus Lokiarchaeia archaeon]
MERSILKKLWDKFIPILIVYFFIEVLVNFILFWNDPTWGFSQFGIGVFFTTLFLPAWLIIYYGCKIIAKRRTSNPNETGGYTDDAQHARE